MPFSSSPAATHPPPQPIIWQITGCGVRPVSIVHAAGVDTACVSRVIATGAAAGPAFGYRPANHEAALADLFLEESDARAEFRRRRGLSHRADDRRRRRGPADGEITPAEAVLAGLALGLTCIMALI